MIKKLTRHGNSQALVIDRAVMDLLNIDMETNLEISTDDGRRLIVAPVREQLVPADETANNLTSKR